MYLPSKLLAQVNKVEKRAHVHRQLMGVDCWPVVRNTFMSLVSHRAPTRKNKVPILSYFYALNDFLSACFFSVKADAMALTDVKYRAQVKGVFYYKDVSVIKDVLEQSGKSFHTFTQSHPQSKGRETKVTSIFFLTALSVFFSKLLMWLDFRNVVPNYIQNIYNSPEFIGIPFDGIRNPKQVEKNIYFVVVASFLFSILLKRIRPKKCYIVCYYSSLGMALCVACKKLGIESVDIQHGVSGSNMRAYGQWYGLPSEGVNTLPNRFYCWTHMDAMAINKWSNKTPNHHAVLMGNIWRQYLVEQGQQFSLDELKILQEVKGYQKVVLYTARSKSLPDLVLDLLTCSPSHCLYVIRMHPDAVESDIEDLKRQLKVTEASYFVINGHDTRIQSVLKLVDIHITEWSAVVYDAFFEGVPSIIISKVGCDYFCDFIQQGYACYHHHGKEILSEIFSSSKLKNKGHLSFSKVRRNLITDFSR